nr:hypothetical protein [Tanacetum cinerariifolium]
MNTKPAETKSPYGKNPDIAMNSNSNKFFKYFEINCARGSGLCWGRVVEVIGSRRGDDGDDDDGDSSGDDADDEDEDEEDEEEEEHLAPTDSAAISFLPEPEVKRLLAMPTLSPSPLALLLPPSAGERLARCTTPAASPLPPPLHMPPPIDHRDDIPETEMPPRKRLCLSTLGSRYEVRESSISRLTGGRWIDYGFVNTLDAKARQRGIGEVGYGIRDTWVDLTKTVPEIAPMTIGEVNTSVKPA